MIHIAGFYSFIDLATDRLDQIRDDMEKALQSRNMRGLLILGTEGLNGTVCGSEEAMNEFKTHIQQYFDVKLTFKDSTATAWPFLSVSVKVKPEIVTFNESIRPTNNGKGHLTPQQWEELRQQPNVIMLDARNEYEYKLGRFKDALDPKIEEFTEFPDAVKRMNIPKDKTVMIYCTGGIRCEKAIYEMNEQGYENVYQLEGGILNYLKEFPDRGFDGECFVFDRRVAVDQQLNPSQTYVICPHCGDPGSTRIECAHCDKPAVICEDCLNAAADKKTCSKNCAHHLRMNHKCHKKYRKNSTVESLRANFR